MKKLLFILFILGSVFVFFGCNGEITTEDPEVSIETPANGATLSGIAGLDFDIKAVALDDYDEFVVINLYIKPDNQLEYSDDDVFASIYADEIEISIALANYQVDGEYFLNTTDYDNGSYNIQARAEDSQGNFGYDEITVEIINP